MSENNVSPYCTSNTLLNPNQLTMVQKRLMNQNETQRFWNFELKKCVSNENIALITGYTEHQLIITPLIFIILSYFSDYIFPKSLKANVVEIFTKGDSIYVIISSLSKLLHYTQEQASLYQKIMDQETNIVRKQKYYPLFVSFGIVSVNLLNLFKYLYINSTNNLDYDNMIQKICKSIQVEPNNKSLFQLENYIDDQIAQVNNSNNNRATTHIQSPLMNDNNINNINSMRRVDYMANNHGNMMNNNNNNMMKYKSQISHSKNRYGIEKVYHFETPQYNDLVKENMYLKQRINQLTNKMHQNSGSMNMSTNTNMNNNIGYGQNVNMNTNTNNNIGYAQNTNMTNNNSNRSSNTNIYTMKTRQTMGNNVNSNTYNAKTRYSTSRGNDYQIPRYKPY
eukprot:198884_1